MLDARVVEAVDPQTRVLALHLAPEIVERPRRMLQEGAGDGSFIYFAVRTRFASTRLVLPLCKWRRVVYRSAGGGLESEYIDLLTKKTCGLLYLI